MRARFCILCAGWLSAAPVFASPSVPPEINYQGTLKEKGVPANGTRAMQFRLTNEEGTQVYWSGAVQNVAVQNGLFSTAIIPTGMDWQNVRPYIEVSIEGQRLLPREPIRSTAYSLVSGGVTDGSVGLTSLDDNLRRLLVPPGAVMLFEGPCPEAWTRFAPLDDAFPMGAADYGAKGGSSTHRHGIAKDGAHNHGGLTGEISSSDYEVSDAGANFTSPSPNHRHPIATDGAHDHGGQTAEASSLPPYVSMVFCRKD